MYRWRSATFILILVVGTSIAETVQNVQEYSTLPESERKKVQVQEYSTLPESERNSLKEDAGKSDYESALRPAVHHKRSIANIARLLLGGNVPPNHPLVKYPEPKAWNLASNIVASFPGQLQAAASSQPEGWGAGRQPGSALQNIQHLFETKAKIIPYTGQVATGLTGLASVKGDLIRQIHSISTQAIAQAAAEAAARALASAAAAHAVTNSIAHSVNPGAQTGIKGGWSSYQNAYAEPHGKTPGEQPGPPYQDSSAHINHYQPPPPAYNPYATQPTNPPAQYNPYPAQPTNPPTQYNPYPAQPTNPPATYNPYASQPTNPPSSYATNPYAIQPTTPPPPVAPTLPTPAAYPQQNQPYQSNGYYTLYNNQPSAHSVHSQTPYTPAPPVPHARPTLSPSTLIATTPSGYSPSLSKPLDPVFSLRKSKTLPIIIYAPDSNNTPLTSFRRAVPVDIFGRNAAQPSSTSSLLSSISSLLSASTAAYNAAIAGSNNPNQPQHQQQQPTTLFSTILPSAHSSHPGSPSIHRPTYAAPAPSVLSSGISSSTFGNGYQQQSANAIHQSNGNYGRFPGSNSPGHFHHQTGQSYPTEARSSSVNSPSYPVNQHVSGHPGTNYAQPGANSYPSQSSQQSPPQFSNGFAGNSAAAANTNNGGRTPGPSYSAAGAGFNPGQHGSGSTGYNGGPGSSPGHVGGWNTQYAGPSPSASTWSTSSPNVYPPGYAGSTSGNFNNPSGGFGGSPSAQFPIASGSSPAQQTYPTPQTNAYQSPAPNSYAQAQSYPQQPTQQNNYPGRYRSPNGNSNGFGGFRNSDMTTRYDSHDLNQSASTMGNDYDDDNNNSQNYDDDDDDLEENTPHHHSHQAQRRNRPNRPKNSYSSSSSSRYPGPGKKRPGPPPKRRPNNHSQSTSSSNNVNKYSENNRNHHHHHQRNKHGNNVRKDVRENGSNGKPFLPNGNKKGSQFDSSAVDVVDASVDDYYYEGDRYNDSDELRNHKTDTDTNKNRWRTKNPSGQRPNSIQNHNSNGRWSGKTPHANQAPPKNVRGNGERPEKSRPKPGPPKGGPHKDHRNKKVPPPHDREPEKKPHQQPKGAPKTEAAQLYRGRIRNEQQPGRPQPQPQPTTTPKYKSRDVYTTLPEYVFRVGERPDVFLRPGTGGKRKQGIFFKGRGFLRPRVGETDGSGGSIPSSGSTKAEALAASPSNDNPYDEALPKETLAEEDLEKSGDSSRTILDTSGRAGEEEEFISASEAVDETARDDVITLSDQVASSTGFITSEEFDPEEREAFVEDVYADDHQSHHHSQRRQDYDEDRVESSESLNEDNFNEDWVDKK